MSQLMECIYTCVTTSDNKCILTSDGKHVIIGPVHERPVEGGGGPAFKVKRVTREVPRDWYWSMVGVKVVPVFFDYDIVFQILVELTANALGVKLKEDEKLVNLTGSAALLKEILATMLGSKGNLKTLEKSIIGDKTQDSVIQVGLDGLKLHDTSKESDITGEKGLPIDLEYLFSGDKLKVSEIYRILSGIKVKLEESNINLSGIKINELVTEHFFHGKIDTKALLYLLFEEDGIQASSLLDKLTNKELFVLLDEDEDKVEEI